MSDRRMYTLFKQISTLFQRDYIVEQGKDEVTGFYYRKWNSGIAECWQTWTGLVTAYATGVGGNKTYGYNKNFTLPFEFVSFTPTANAVVGSGIAEIMSARMRSSTEAYIVWAGNQLNVNSTLQINIKGIWKELENPSGGVVTRLLSYILKRGVSHG